MSLDVGIPLGDQIDYRLSFENDGYYWFLHPLFEAMHQRIGIYIDLYGDAEFAAENIKQLESLLDKASEMVAVESDIWNVCIGTQTHPVKKDLFCRVSKKEFDSKLKTLREMAAEVRKKSAKLIFVGD